VTWRILIANLTLAGHTGTEVVTRDLALGLAARGHEVTVFVRAIGPLATELTEAGIAVVRRLDEIAAPDIVHGHHYQETIDALRHFPVARGVFVCHDRTAPHSIPPRFDRIRRYVAVDLNCLERLRDDWDVPAVQTRVVLNAVDMARFSARPPLPAAPTRALVYSHYASPATHVDVVRDACTRLNIPVDVIGSEAGTAVIAPDTRLGEYDLVFGKARCALEAVAVGAAVVLCDAGGLGPMVTLAALPGLRAWNLGSRLLRDGLEAEAVVRRIRQYDPVDAAAASRAVRAEASLVAAIDQYETIYAEVMAETTESAPAGTELQTLIAPLLQRVGALEAELAAYRRPDRMLALSDADVSGLRVSLVSAPSAMSPGGSAFVRVRLENGARDQTLGTWPPFPLNWGYRWRAADEAEFAAPEDLRTPIRRSIPPGEIGDCAVKIVAPRAPGHYVLRITLVQEGLRWLDDTATPVLIDVPVSVS